jgi:hypothetical protein
LSCIGVISPVIASEAKQSSASKEDWIASSQELLAMTGLAFPEIIHSEAGSTDTALFLNVQRQ